MKHDLINVFYDTKLLLNAGKAWQSVVIEIGMVSLQLNIEIKRPNSLHFLINLMKKKQNYIEFMSVYTLQHKYMWYGPKIEKNIILIPRSCRVTCTQVVTRDEGTKGKCNKSQEGHPDRRTSHFCELVFPPVWLPIINPGGCWWGCWYEKIS